MKWSSGIIDLNIDLENVVRYFLAKLMCKLQVLSTIYSYSMILFQMVK